MVGQSRSGVARPVAECNGEAVGEWHAPEWFGPEGRDMAWQVGTVRPGKPWLGRAPEWFGRGRPGSAAVDRVGTDRHGVAWFGVEWGGGGILSGLRPGEYTGR